MPGPEVTAKTYAVELLFERDYSLDDPSLADAIHAACPLADVRTGVGPVAIFHRDVPIALADGNFCAQTAVLGTDAPVGLAELEPALAQSRAWPGARDVVSRATRRLLVTDLMSSSLAASTRLEVFQRALAPIVAHLQPIAIVWIGAGKLVEPAAFLAALRSPEPTDRALVALNVRLFEVADERGGFVMDTLGLAALGLPDLQLHAQGLDPNDVARVLFNTALYVLSRGDVLIDGHTIDGGARGQKWRCRRDDALVGPHRAVVDLDPGPPWAAGQRPA